MHQAQHKIRKAETHDIDALTQLFDAYRVFYEKESDLPAAKTFLLERIKNNDSEIFIAFNAENIAMGFVQLYPLFSSTRMKRLWLLNDLYVQPGYRGKKVSVALIEKAKEVSRNSKAAGLMLETAKSNLIGNSLYVATDFVLDEEHNYYSWSE